VIKKGGMKRSRRRWNCRRKGKEADGGKGT
jgi:hypothetical protein